jgi:hypothetical protein
MCAGRQRKKSYKETRESLRGLDEQMTAIAVLQLLYTEATMPSGFFLKKKPPCTPPDRARELGNRSDEPTSSLRS